MFYDAFAALCEERGIRPSKAAEECGINKSNVSNWKNNGYVPRGDAINKIADYFDIPTDFLLGNGAFFCWKEINANRKAFIDYTGISKSKLWLIWCINADNVNTISLHDFIHFINTAIKDVTLTADGDFIVKLKEGFQEQKEKLSDKVEEPDITFNDFTYALHNETKELTEENKQKLLEMARFFKEQQDKAKNK